MKRDQSQEKKKKNKTKQRSPRLPPIARRNEKRGNLSLMHEKKKKKEETNIYIYIGKKRVASRSSIGPQQSYCIPDAIRLPGRVRARFSSILSFSFLFFCLRSIHPLPILFSSIKKKKIAPRTLSLERSRTVRTKLR